MQRIDYIKQWVIVVSLITLWALAISLVLFKDDILVLIEEEPKAYEIPEAVDVLIKDRGNPNVLPHTVDKKTYFAESLNHLVEGSRTPELEKPKQAIPTTHTTPRKKPKTQTTPVAKTTPNKPVVKPPPKKEKKIDSITVKLPANIAKSSPKEPSDINVPKGLQSHSSDIEVSKSGFSSDEDWNGIVLVPDMAVMSKAYTTLINLPRLEAHPLTDGRLRVWARIQNKTKASNDFMIACAFSFQEENEEDDPSADFYPITVPFLKFQDISFTSNKSGVISYTLLVKSK